MIEPRKGGLTFESVEVLLHNAIGLAAFNKIKNWEFFWAPAYGY